MDNPTYIIISFILSYLYNRDHLPTVGRSSAIYRLNAKPSDVLVYISYTLLSFVNVLISP